MPEAGRNQHTSPHTESSNRREIPGGPIEAECWTRAQRGRALSFALRWRDRTETNTKTALIRRGTRYRERRRAAWLRIAETSSGGRGRSVG